MAPVLAVPVLVDPVLVAPVLVSLFISAVTTVDVGEWLFKEKNRMATITAYTVLFIGLPLMAWISVVHNIDPLDCLIISFCQSLFLLCHSRFKILVLLPLSSVRTLADLFA